MKGLRLIAIAMMLCFAMAIVSACGTNGAKEEAANTAEASTAPTAASEATATTEVAATRMITDVDGRTVEVPVSPQRLVFLDSTLGDILLFGIQPVGVAQEVLKNSVYYDQIKDIPDVGWTVNLEKLVTLEPDLIITSNPDPAVLENLSKVAPTLLTNEWDSTADRIKRIGDWFGYEKEAEEFLAQYEAKATEMWTKLAENGGVKEGETASVFQYQLSEKRLTVYTKSYLPTFIYRSDKLAFKPTEPIQKLIDDPDNYGYAEISIEVLPEYAGDRIFIVYFNEDEKKLIEEMIKDPIWSKLPAVKNGKTYFVHGGIGISTDPLAREKLIEEMPIILQQ